MAEGNPVKSYYVQLPGYEQGEVWDEEKFNRNKEQLYKDHPDAQAVETSPLGQEEVVNDDGMFTVKLPGYEKGELWDGAKLNRNREQLLKDHPDAEITKATPVNYWGDRLGEISTRIDALENELKGIPDAERNMSMSDADALDIIADTPERRRRNQINTELDQLKRERENNPAWQSYWDKQKEELKGSIKQMEEDADISKGVSTKNEKGEYDLRKYGSSVESDYFKTAKQFYKDALKTAEAPSKYDDSLGIVNFAKGAAENIGSAVSLLEFAKALKNVNVIGTVKQIQEAEGENVNLIDLIENQPERLSYLSPGQKEMMKAFIKRAEIEQDRSGDMSIGYNAGAGAIQSLGFMGDFLLTGGAGSAAGKAVAKKLVKEAAEDISAKTLSGAAKKLLVGNLEGATKALVMTPMMPSSYSSFLDNMTQLNSKGGMDLTGKAVLNSVGDALIETFSENAGELFGIPFEGKMFDTLSKSKLGEVGKAMSRTGAGRFLNNAGWHGMVGEMAEEVLGNAIRSATGIDDDALKNFFSKDEFLTTLASFAPMSIIGGASSAYQVRKAGKRMSDSSEALAKILGSYGMEASDIESLLNVDGKETPEELGNAIASIGRAADAAGNVEDVASLGKALGEYAIAASRYKVLKGAFENEQDVQRASNAAMIDSEVGDNNWYHQGEGGNYVRTITDAEGNESYVISQQDGELALVDRQGNKYFMTESSLANGIESGAITDSGEIPINQYLDGVSEKEQKNAEEQRMTEEVATQLTAIQQRIAADPSINMGTEEAPKMGVVDAVNANGVHVIWQDEDGAKDATLTWEQVGNYLGTPVQTKTDEQIEQEEIAAEEDIRRRKEDYNNSIPEGTEISVPLEGEENPVTYQFKRAFIDEDGNMLLQVTDKETGQDVQITEDMALQGNLTTILDSLKNQTPAEAVAEAEAEQAEIAPVEDDGILRDFRGNPIPLKDDGTVNQTAFWNADPEAWAKWNDQRRNDGGENSRGYVAKAIKKLQGDAKAVQKQIAKELDFDKIDQLEGQLAQINNRIATLDGIEAGYAAAEAEQKLAQEVAKAEVAEETPAPVAPVAEAKEAPKAEATSAAQEEIVPPTAEQVLDEFFADVNRRLGEAKTPEEREAIIQEKRQALEDYYAITTTDPTVVGTRADILQRMKEMGYSEKTIGRVKDQLNAKGVLTEGFHIGNTIFIVADDIRDARRAKLTHLHEHWHEVNRQKGYPKDVAAMPGATTEYLLETANKLAGVKDKNGYGDYLEYPNPQQTLADEVIALSMEVISESTPENVDENLRKAGLDNQEIINFVKTIYNGERGNDQEADSTGRDTLPGDNAQEGERQDGGDIAPQPEGILGEQGSRPGEGSDQGTGGEAEQGGEVTPTLSPNQQAAIDFANGEITAPEIRLDNRGAAANGEEVRFSVRYSWKDSEVNKIAQDIADQIGVKKSEAKKWVKSETSLAALITGEGAFLDYEGDDRYTAIKQDSDYPQGTVDFNNICRKRLAFTEMYQRVQKAFPNTIITGEDLATIRNIMKKHDLMVACGLCYVEDRRQLLGEIAKDFIDNVNTNFDIYASRGGETKKKNAEKFRNLIGEDKKEDLSIYDLITLEGSTKLLREHPGIYNAFQAFNNARGQQSGNLFQGYAEYKREILKWNKKKVKSVNDNGGLRIFSYSDFEAHHLIDLVQIIQDCARKGVKIQGYTKVPAFARAVAETGVKLNRSLIPLGDTGMVDGKLAYDPVEGIDVNDENFLPSNDNIGNILIGINDEQIRLAMADPFVHFIIPYHSNQKDILRSMKQTGNWTNYKLSQTEKDANGKTAEHVNIYTDVLNAAEAEGKPIKNEREFTEKFLEVCKDRGLTPRFAQFLDKNEAGEYVYTPGYYKFLVDFKLFDEQGNILPQMPVKAVFDDEFNAQILNDYVKDEKAKLGENLDDVYNEIVKALGLETRKSDIAQANEKQKQPMTEAKEPVVTEEDVMFRLSKNNKATVESWLKKREDLNDEQRAEVVDYIDKLDDAKTQLATAKWYANGKIRIPEDMPKVKQAISVAGKAKVDPLQYDSPMALLDAHAEFKPTEERINPDEVSTLHRAAEYPDSGIVVYDVDSTKESRENMRKIINTHFGEAASPWCLLQGDGKGNLTKDSERYWKHYNAYPKQVAFKDGKLLAFSANDRKTRLWWDRQDQSHYGIPVTQKVEGDELGRSANFIIEDGRLVKEPGTHLFKGNKQNGVYEEWSSDGNQILERTNYKDGQEDGLTEAWYFNGQMQRRTTMKDGNYVGRYEAWFDNGQKQVDMTLTEEGFNDGERRAWWKNGNLRSEGRYKNSKRVGEHRTWDEDGTLQSVQFYSEDADYLGFEEHGEWGLERKVTFTEDGGQEEERYSRRGDIMSIERTNGKGRLNGLQELNFIDGTPHVRATYSDGVLDGVREAYFPNGNLQARGEYKNGAREGIHEIWNRDGDLVIRQEYHNDEKVRDLPLEEPTTMFRKAFDSAEGELGSEQVSVDNPDLMKEYNLSYVTMTKKGDVVTLNKVVVADQKKGNGTRFMQDFTKEADNEGWTLALTPDDSFGATSVSRLKKFYKRFGFKENKGRNADPTINESMIRKPEEVRFRLSNREQMDKDYMAAVEAGDMETAQAMVDNMAEAAGYNIRGYHGTTHDFTIFDRSKGNAEGNWGKGFYFTNNLDDAEANYAGEGPDLTNRIELLAENMAWMDGYEDMTDEQRLEEARKQLAGDNPHVITAAIKMENPVVFDSRFGEDETYFDYEMPEYNEETDEYEGEPTGKLVDFVEAWNDVMSDMEWEGNNISPDEILEYGEYDGLTASQLEKKAREILDTHGIEDYNGQLASGEFLRQVFERMGFDGILDKNVNQKFGTQRRYGRSMEGVDYGTTHVVAFNSNQIKQSDPVTYDDDGKVIPLSQRFDSWNEDIRFRKANQTQNGFISNAEMALDKIKMDKATPEQWIKMLEKEGGMKAGEDKWLGLSDWLKASDKKTLTKDEVSDFIEQNRIQIEEQRYSEAAEANDEVNGREAMERINDEFHDYVSEYQNGEVENDYNWYSATDYAMSQMVEKYGEDFREAFELNGRDLMPMQEYDDAHFNSATRKYLGLNKEGVERPINPTRLEYTTHGLDNKKEIALTVPTIDTWNQGDEIHFGDAGDGRAVAWIRFGDARTERGAGDAPLEVRYKGAEPADEPHRRAVEGILLNWNDNESVMRNERRENQFWAAKSMFENSLRDNYYEGTEEQRTRRAQTLAVLDEIKEEDFEPVYEGGERVLVIDEIQSNRHQQAREKGGYRDDATGREKATELGERRKSIREEQERLRKEERELLDRISKSEEAQSMLGEDGFILPNRKEDYDALLVGNEELSAIREARADLLREDQDIMMQMENLRDEYRRAVPAAPFEKNWYELAMKRMLRLAAEEGYDKIAWTTGDQQAERYNLSTVVRRIEGGIDAIGRRVLEIDYNGGGATFIHHDAEGNIERVDGVNTGVIGDATNISEVVGKEIAVGVLSIQKSGVKNNKVYEGDNLRIGGEGMRGFYDDILPRFMNKYGKKWGVKVEDVTLPNIGEGQQGLTMHSVDVTPEMKESVMEGQVMFRLGEKETEEEVEKFKQKYTPIAPMTTKLAEEDNISKGEGDKDGITIFANRQDDEKDAENTCFHENIHSYADKEGIGEDRFKELDALILLGFDEEARKEELEYLKKLKKDETYKDFPYEELGCQLLSEAMQSEYIDELFKSAEEDVPSTYELLKDFFEQLNYDARAEAESRRKEDSTLDEESDRGTESGSEQADDAEAGEDQEGREEVTPASETSVDEYGDAEVQFRKVTNPETLDRLNSEPTIKVYRAMQEIDGKLYPPMAAKVDGKLQEPIELGEWEEAVERPDLADNKGYFTLNKGNGKSLKARYNPYIHTSRSPLNDQFTSAYNRPNLVTVEVEVPESELTSGYKAEKAKDSVGEMNWHSGPVSSKLPEEKTRKVILTRYDKPVRIVPDSEVADRIAELLEGENIAVPYNTITPSLREELEKRGVEISDVPSGLVAQREAEVQFRISQDAVKESHRAGLTGVIGDENEAELYRNVYKAVPKEIREQIVNKAGNSYLFSEATKDMISEAVEKGDETGIAGLAANMLRDYAGPLDEKTARYILWRGDRKQEDDDLLDTVKDIAMQRKLRVGEFAERPMFRLGEDIEEAENRAESMAEDAKATMDEKKEVARADNALNTIKAMSIQKEYDRKTVNTLTVLAKNILKDQSIETLNRREIARLLGIITTSIGKAPKTVKKNADALVGLIVDHMLKSEETKLGMLASTRATKTNATGVEVQGTLDVRGQNVLKAYKAGLDMDLENPTDEFDENTINGRIAVLTDRLESKDDAVRSEAEDELAGLMLAKEYQENIKASINEERGIKNEMKDAAEQLRDGKISRTAYNEFVSEAEKSIRENRIERIEAYQNLRSEMVSMMAGSIDARKEFTENEKKRVEEIHHLANSDMQGKEASPFAEPTRWSRIANSSLVRFFAKPLVTFDQMLRLFGEKSVAGEGYLWNKFHRGWIEASEKAYLGEKEAKSELDEKVSEVFDKDMRWSDLYDVERKMPKVKVRWWDGGELKEHELTQGNLLYIYMVNKMTDGRMKLRKMGITQATVDAIKRQMDDRFIELADWVQEKFLVEKRNKYNAVHERLFGASMAAIEDYFPLKINKRSLNKAEDLGRPDFDDALPATTTGSIIKRKRNAQDLDLLNADAFSTVIEHVEQMEQWAAFAEFNKDLNTLLSYKRFRNQVQNMATVYGSGSELWRNFKSVSRIVGGTYSPAGKKSDLDTAALNVAKGVTSAKISFRVYTALKQLLSMPAFISDANIKYLGENLATPWKAWNWAMENLPLFEKRVRSRMAGDTRLMNTDSDWKFFRSKVYDTLSRLGMSPNAFVDALTVSIGSHSIYQTRYDRYIKDGYTEEEADKKAKQDATTLYNETQQSNEGAFVAPVQLDRTVLATMITVFRNSSMGYQRQLHDAIRNIGKMMKPGYKEASIEFMKKQMERDGLTEEQAQHAAERNYEREKWRSAARVATFGFLVQFAWNLGGSIAYLLFGDDDDKKKEMLREAFLHGLIGGSMEGLSGGNVMSEAINMMAKGESLSNYDPSLLPIISDMKSAYKKMSYDPVAGSNDLINLAIQAGIGVNPQTLTDAVVAVVDACGGDLETSKEALLLMMRVLQVPQSQIDQVYIDELGVNADKARTMSAGEMAERYARYKVMKGAPLTGWAYSDEAEEKREKAYLKSFKKKVKERKEINKPKDKKR